ncbi:MAG: DUF5317 domain-containing protein [Acidimicrobiales bacterium]|nr:DUF5317 domain-containing protein [Acidimicrobiales bacterium]MCB9394234.1 DUF5317 domain-containing protein [Acidimicrobiaceae bacterium]
MIVIALMVVAIVSVPLCGGRLAAIGRVEVEETWLIILGFVVQTAVISMAPQGLEPIAHAVHLASYLLAAAFLVINLHVPWLWLIGLGGGMNFAAIVANGGTMPAGEWATRVAGMVIADGEFANSEMVADPKLLFLGDVFPIPASWPLSNVFSVGDVLLVVGAFALLHSVSGSHLSGARRAARRAATNAETEGHVGFVTRNDLVDAS